MTVVPDAGSTATVLVSDLSACKAYVQVIDTVLIPEAVSMSMTPSRLSAYSPPIGLSIHLSVCLSGCLYVMSLHYLPER